MASNGDGGNLPSNSSQSSQAAIGSALDGKSQSVAASLTSSSKVSKRSRSRIPVRTGGSTQRRSQSVSSSKSTTNSVISVRRDNVGGLPEAPTSDMPSAQVPMVVEPGSHADNGGVHRQLPSQLHTGLFDERSIVHKEMPAIEINKAVEMVEPEDVQERLVADDVVEVQEMQEQPMAKEMAMQMPVPGAKKDQMVSIGTGEHPAARVPVKFAIVQLSTVVPLHTIHHLHKIAVNRYVERSVWLQQFANKIREVEVQLGPPPSAIEIKTGTVTATESIASSSLTRSESEALPSDQITPSKASGSSVASSAVEDSAGSEPLVPAETRLLPLAGYATAPSTADVEKTDDIPKTSTVSSISTQMPDFTEVTFEGKAEFSSSYASSMAPASAVESKITQTSQPASKLESESEPSPVKQSQPSEWKLLAESLDVREFIAQMMHPLPPMDIETVDLNLVSHPPIAYVFLNEKGQVIQVCDWPPKSDNEEVD